MDTFGVWTMQGACGVPIVGWWQLLRLHVKRAVTKVSRQCALLLSLYVYLVYACSSCVLAKIICMPEKL
jgi:hypothetical protein